MSDKQGLAVIRVDIRGALEVAGGLLELALGEAGAGEEVMRLEQVGIAGDGPVELGHRLRISLAERQGEATRGMRFGKAVVQIERLRAGRQDAVDRDILVVVEKEERIAIRDPG